MHYKHPGCPLYETTANVLNLFKGLKIDSVAGTVTVGVPDGAYQCFDASGDVTKAFKKLSLLTDVDLSTNTPQTITFGAF